MRTSIKGRVACWLRLKWVYLLCVVVFTVALSGCSKPPPTPLITPEPTPTPTPEPKSEVILRLHGSRTIGENLMPDLVEKFLEHKKASDITWITRADPNQLLVQGMIPGSSVPQMIEILSGDSAMAFKNLAAGECDIGFASRRIEREELEALAITEDMTAAADEHIVALDGIAIIVGGENPIETLSKDQIVSIFSGDIQNWAEVGGEAGPITVYALEQDSGTYEAFEQLVLGDQALTESAVRIDSSLALSEEIFGDNQGIGFVSLAHIGGAKAVAVQDGRAIPLSPGEEYIAAEDYPLAQRLYFYLPREVEHPFAQEFVDFVLSQKGQEVVAQHGFIDLNIKLGSFPGYARTRDREYQEITKGAEKLSLNIRFRYDSAELDSRASQDIKRIEEFLREHETYEDHGIILLGFCDNVGSQDYNERLSKERAQSVEDALHDQRVSHPIWIKGFGKNFPVATNDTAEGMAKNRRVEIWLFNPDWNSGSNCNPEGATVIALNGIDRKGSADYRNGDRTDWYLVNVREEGTLTYHLWQQTQNSTLFIEFYGDPETSPLNRDYLDKQDVYSFAIEDAEPGIYYAKVFVGSESASSYVIANTFFPPGGSPPPVPVPVPVPDVPIEDAPLQITIVSPGNESIITEDSVVIRGRVENANNIALLTINGEQVSCNEEGGFAHEVTPLNMGPNSISVSAWDADGDIATVEIKVIHQ